MSSKRRFRKPPPPRQRTVQDVIRTHLAIITSPVSGQGNVSLHADVELAKAAVLYADTVEILSLGQQMVQSFQDFSRGPEDSLYALMNSLDDSTLQHLSGGADPAQLRQTLTMMTGLDPEALRAVSASSPELAELATFADVLQESRAGATSSMNEMRALAEQMRLDSGAAELDVAFATKQVRYNDRVPLSGDTDAVVAAFMAEMKRYLEDPYKFVLLDGQTASLVRSMIKEGVVELPDRSVANASEVLLGTGFLSKLPTFPAARMEQVLELKAGLEEPLGRYRRKVTDLRSHLLTGPFDEHAGAEVHGIWRTEIDPAVTDIRNAMSDHTLAKELLREAGVDIAQFVKGAVPRGGLTVLAANAFDVNTAVTAGLTAGAAAIPIAARALTARKKGRTAAQANDLYYLHAVDQELDRRSPTIYERDSRLLMTSSDDPTSAQAQGDAIRDYVFAIVNIAVEDDVYRITEFLGTGFFIGSRGYGLTARHVLAQAKTVAIVMPTSDQGWRLFAVKEEDSHPSEDISVIRIQPPEFGHWRSIFSLPSAWAGSGLSYLLFGYPDSAMREVVDNGMALFRPDLIYSEGHIRRRLTDLPLPAIKGTRFLELSQVAGAGCSGSPVFNSASAGRAAWQLIGIYVGERLDSDSTSVGYAVRLDDLRDWEPEMLGRSLAAEVTDRGLTSQ